MRGHDGVPSNYRRTARICSSTAAVGQQSSGSLFAF
jgi:hypothetical protein